VTRLKLSSLSRHPSELRDHQFGRIPEHRTQFGYQTADDLGSQSCLICSATSCNGVGWRKLDKTSGSFLSSQDFSQGHDCSRLTNSYFGKNEQASDSTIESNILELGVLLHEIWKQSRFEAWLAESRIPPSTDYYLSMGMAIQWLKSVPDSVTSTYADAVSVCVRFSLEGVQHDWENPSFRRALCEKVVAFLQENCKAWLRPP